MKKIILLILIAFSITKSKAQTNYTPTGTWQYTNEHDTIIFYLKVDNIVVSSTLSYPILIGFHKYVKNGIIVENNLQYLNSTYSDNRFSIIIYNDAPSDIRHDGDINDITLCSSHLIITKKINPAIMDVTLSSKEGRQKQCWQQGYTLPRHFILVKQ